MDTKQVIRGALVLAWVATTTWAQAANYALVVGADPNATSAGRSDVLVDARSFRQALLGVAGFRAANISILLGTEATEGEFVRALGAIFSKLRAGDSLVATFSGDGACWPSGGEARPAWVLSDRVVVPLDMMQSLAASLSERGVNSTWVFDMGFGPGARFAEVGDGFRRLASVRERRLLAQLRRRDPAARPGSIAYLFAAEEGKPAALFEPTGESRRSAFAWAFSKRLTRSPRASLRELLALARDELSELGVEIRPRLLEGTPRRGESPLTP